VDCDLNWKDDEDKCSEGEANGLLKAQASVYVHHNSVAAAVDEGADR
jgi:hypothetical protein